MTIFNIIGLVVAIIGLIILYTLAAKGSNLKYAIGIIFLVLGVGMLLQTERNKGYDHGYTEAINEGYKKGQVDALNGKQVYKMHIEGADTIYIKKWIDKK